MDHRVFLVFVLVLVSTKTASSHVVGDICSLKNGGSGTCRVIHDCESAIKQLQVGQSPNTCGFQGMNPIVCCEQGGGAAQYPVHNTPAPKVITTTKPTDVGTKSRRKCEEYSSVNHVAAQSPIIGMQNVDNVPSCPISARPLIISGPASFPDAHRYAVLLGHVGREGTSWRCPGALISELFVLTSVSCTLGPDRTSLRKVRLGDQNDNGTHIEVGVSEVIPHPHYNKREGLHDIALLRLSTAVRFNRHILPACLPTQDEDAGPAYEAVEWGTELDADQHDQLMDEVGRLCDPNNTDARCMLYDSQICMTRPEQLLCLNCKGGLLQVIHQTVYCMQSIIGVLANSWCTNPTDLVVNKYTRVSQYVGWIEGIVWP